MQSPTNIKPFLSLVIPLYNEEELIEELYKRVLGALSAINDNFEVICVDDGSQDKTYDLLKKINQEDKRFKVISFSRNFGHQPAIFAGLNYAEGEYVAIIDGDLQDPPEELNTFLDKLKDGYDVVYAIRKKRKEGFIKKFLYWSFYRLLKRMSSISIPLDSGDFCIMRKNVVESIIRQGEQSLFLRGIRSWVGFSQIGQEYNRHHRHAGDVKYSISKLIKLGLNGLFSFSSLPVKVITTSGIFVIFLSFIYILYVVTIKLISGEVPQGFTALIVFMSIFSGVQLLSLGIIGEYVLRIYDESRKRPLYIVKKAII